MDLSCSGSPFGGAGYGLHPTVSSPSLTKSLVRILQVSTFCFSCSVDLPEPRIQSGLVSLKLVFFNIYLRIRVIKAITLAFVDLIYSYLFPLLRF